MLEKLLLVAFGLSHFVLQTINTSAQSFNPSPQSSNSPKSESVQAVEYPPLAIPIPVQVERQCSITDVVVLIDSTRSMGGYAKNQTKLSVAQWCALNVADAIPDGLPAAFIKLEDSAATIRQLSPLVGEERTALRQSIMQLRAFGGDANKANQGGTLERLFEAAQQILQHDKARKPLVILVTDGVDCDPYSSFDELNALKSSFEEKGFYFQLIGICDNSDIAAKLSALSVVAGKNGYYSSVTSYVDLPASLSKTYELMRSVREQRECDFNSEREALLLELTRLHNEAHSRFHQNQRLLSEIQKLCRDKKSLIEQNESLNLRIRELETERSKIVDRVRAIVKENAAFSLKVKDLESELRVAIKETERVQKENVELSFKVKELEGELRVSRDELARMREELIRLREEEKKASWLNLLTSILLAALCVLLATTLFLLLWLARCSAERERLQLEVARLQAENCASQRQPNSSQRGKRGKKGDKGDKGDPGQNAGPGGIQPVITNPNGPNGPAAGTKCQPIELGSIETTESKSEWGKPTGGATAKACDNVAVSLSKTTKQTATAKVCGPEAVMNANEADIKKAAMVAKDKVTLQSILANYLQAIEPFKAAFLQALPGSVSRSNLTVELQEPTKEIGDWKPRSK